MLTAWRKVRCPGCDRVLYLRAGRLTTVVSRNSRAVFLGPPAAVQCRGCGFEIITSSLKQQEGIG